MKYIMMVCLMALGQGAWAQEETFTAKLFKSKGSVECLKKGAADWIPVEAPYMLYEGDQVRTGNRSKAEIYIKYGSKIRLDAGTTFNIQKVAPEGNAVEVLKGKMQAWIRKFAGRTFSVRTPSAVCAVRGTVFGVEVAEDGGAVWDLFSGSVQISDNRNNSVDLREGERLAVSAAADAPAPAPEPLPADVKPPVEPAKIKEEKVEMKSETAAIKAQEQVRTQEQVKVETKAEEQVQVQVQEPKTSVIPTGTVKESEEVSASTP